MATIVFSTFGAEAGVSNYKYGKGKIIFEKKYQIISIFGYLYLQEFNL